MIWNYKFLFYLSLRNKTWVQSSQLAKLMANYHGLIWPNSQLKHIKKDQYSSLFKFHQFYLKSFQLKWAVNQRFVYLLYEYGQYNPHLISQERFSRRSFLTYDHSWSLGRRFVCFWERTCDIRDKDLLGSWRKTFEVLLPNP